MYTIKGKNNDKGKKKAFQRLLNDLWFSNNLVLWESLIKQSVVMGRSQEQETLKVFLTSIGFSETIDNCNSFSCLGLHTAICLHPCG